MSYLIYLNSENLDDQEVRMETEGKINLVKKMAVQEHNEMLASLQSITDRVSNLEKSVNTTLSSVLPRLDQLEQRLTHQAQEHEAETLQHEQEMNELKSRMMTLETNYLHSSRAIDGLLAHIEKLENYQREYDNQVTSKFEAMERRFTESICQTQDNVYHRIEENQYKTNAITSQLMNDLITKEGHLKQKLQEQHDQFFEKTTMLEENIYESDKRIFQSLKELDDSLSQKIQSKHDILESMVTIQEGLKTEAENLESETRKQFYAVDDEIQSIHDLISRNNTIIADKIVEKDENDEKNFEALSEELSMLKDALHHVQDNMSMIDHGASANTELEPIIRSQVREVLMNEMTVAKSLSGLMNMSSSGLSRSHRSRPSSHRSRKYTKHLPSEDFSDILSGDEADSYDSGLDEDDLMDDSSSIMKRRGRQGRLRITKELCAKGERSDEDELSPIRPRTQKRASTSRKSKDIHPKSGSRPNTTAAAAQVGGAMKTLATGEYPVQEEPPAEAPSQTTQQAKKDEVDLKEVLASFLDVYLVDQQAIRDRLNELTDQTSQQQQQQQEETSRQQRTNPSGSTIVHEEERDRSEARKSMQPPASQYYSDSKLILNEENPLLQKKSASASNVLSMEKSQAAATHSRPSRSKLQSTSSGDESSSSQSRRPQVPRQQSSTLRPTTTVTNIPKYSKSSSARELAAALQGHPKKPSSASQQAQDAFGFDDVYEENKDYAHSPSLSPVSSPNSRVLSPFFSRIPRPTRSNSSTPRRSESPPPVPPIHISPQRSTSRARDLSKHSPFSNPLSRKPKLAFLSKKDRNEVHSPGSDTSTITSSTSTSTTTLLAAGYHYPDHSLSTHLLGAAARVKPTAPTRIL
jgi:hypothetical protein